ncbi:PREDICTED: ALBINO3-like protein 1, chloroplastic [Camelina sativa]|uniref:ALBINO3-like protein 1, chloroplastic n=2 Tax=Camelina sativa TaxID=90675 RepID=A0ABM1R7P1_CAMSA|nr:PREDICTED: ALBINO3-like protein 1, chloroplastic [Camelina sativa]XP_019095029.1 PREDICTED: ALBINO3-like protein 1, chloroplastic [Camelina sativa]
MMMASSISLKPTTSLTLLSSFSTGKVLHFRRSRITHSPSSSSSYRYRTLVAQFGFRPGSFPDPGDSFDFIKDHAENLLYTIADAAVSSSETFESVAGTNSATKNSDWFSGIANYMETILKVLKDGLSTVNVPYSYGFAIILLTVLVKAATFPLTKKQVESAMAMKSLTPQIKAIQERYAGDQERIQLETARLYKLAGINPLAGCLPTLATIPVWIGLYRALSNVADEGLLTEGFFWIPSLAGPTTVAARQSGSGISWLFPFIEGNPPLGWPDTLAYLVLPLLLVFSQYLSIQIMQSSQSNDPAMKSSQAVTKLLPLMIGYFALSVPSGLSLYWLTNNILSTAQQVWLQKYGGAKNPMEKFTNLVTKEDKTQKVEKSISETLVQKSVSELKVPGEKGGEKLTPEGPKPGERFRLLKEQEAKRRREKEEARLKAEAALSNQNTDEALEQDGISDTAVVPEGDKEKSKLSAVEETTDGTVTVNGKPSIQKDETTNGKLGVDQDIEQHHSHET